LQYDRGKLKTIAEWKFHVAGRQAEIFPANIDLTKRREPRAGVQQWCVYQQKGKATNLVRGQRHGFGEVRYNFAGGNPDRELPACRCEDGCCLMIRRSALWRIESVECENLSIDRRSESLASQQTIYLLAKVENISITLPEIIASARGVGVLYQKTSNLMKPQTRKKRRRNRIFMGEWINGVHQNVSSPRGVLLPEWVQTLSVWFLGEES